MKIMSLPSKRVNNKFWVFLSPSGKRFRMWCVTFLNHRLFFERISSILICCFSNGVAFFLHQPINMSITSSQITGLNHWFVTQLVQANNYYSNNIKACISGTLWRESINDWWIPLTKGQQYGNLFRTSYMSYTDSTYQSMTEAFYIISQRNNVVPAPSLVANDVTWLASLHQRPLCQVSLTAHTVLPDSNVALRM